MENLDYVFMSFFLGIVQGLTEFLPISSSAHLVLMPYFFNWKDPGLTFDVALHLGTLAAILIYFKKDWQNILLQIAAPKKARAKQDVDWKWIAIGTLPAGVIGLLFEKQAEHAFRNPYLIAVTLAVFGFLLWFFDSRGKKKFTLDSLSLKTALIIGFAQAMAIVPGVSRSGITITAALFLGLRRESAFRFSFLLSAPIIAGAGLLKFPKIFQTLIQGGPESLGMLIGFVASLVSGLFAIVLLKYMAEKRSFKAFAVYRLLLALAIVVYFKP